MIQPETYRGYNDKGECLVTKTAVDATTLLDPSQVQKAVEEITNAINDSSQTVFNKLLQADASGNRAMLVSDADMSESFGVVENEIRNIPNTIGDSLSSLVSEAESARDQLQEVENNKAYNSCYIENVVTVGQ